MNLSSPINQITGIGSVTARHLKKLDIVSVRDLLLYLPFRYEDFSHQSKIADLQAGEVATITATIELIQNKRSPRRRMNLTEALVTDGTDSLRVIWFNQPFLTRNLKNGDEISLAGRVSEDYGGLVMNSPQYEKTTHQAIHTQGIVPVYHITSSLSQKGFRSAMSKVIHLAPSISDWLPAATVRDQNLISLGQALRQIHFPENHDKLKEAKLRLGFDELLLMQLRAQKQHQTFAKLKAPALLFHEELTKQFVSNLAFDLTADQKKAAWEIINDIQKEQPMLRLLQGDVGSGKTVVAALALLNTALSGAQGAFMAPTEILAAQHFKTLTEFVSKVDISICLLTSSYHKMYKDSQIIEASKKELIAEIANGGVSIIIGTHALIQKSINFKNLALTVVDEQHRFGVEQRKVLTEKVEKGRAPHLVSMTATPIPRSLALAIYGDLDVSVIKQMLVGRKEVLTKVIPETKREEMYKFVVKEFEAGNQAFIVCPLIDESDTLGFKSVKAEFERLDKTIFKNYKIGLLHGKLKTAEREVVMQEFMDNKIKAIVTTSIIEIGVDVPNATVMIVEDADRFGLAQLHQYRGRVGRRKEQGYCFLLAPKTQGQVNKRLEAMTQFSNGFDLAKADLSFRGPGEVYGLAQKGFPELRMANFYDIELMKKARDVAISLISNDPQLSNLPAIAAELGDWQERAHLE